MSPEGFEPSSTGPKPVALSRLCYGPMFSSERFYYLSLFNQKCYKFSLFNVFMRNLLIILLVLLVLGLYFYTDFTKEVMVLTGDFVKEKSKDILNTIN